MFDSGFDATDTSAMPSFSNPFRSSAPDGGSLAVNLATHKADMLSSTAGMSGAPRTSRMLATGARRLPFLGGAMTGYQTYQNNPANLGPAGRMAHAGITGVTSALTPPMLGIADAATGNYGANAIEDASGAMLRSILGPKEEA